MKLLQSKNSFNQLCLWNVNLKGIADIPDGCRLYLKYYTKLDWTDTLTQMTGCVSNQGRWNQACRKHGSRLIYTYANLDIDNHQSSIRSYWANTFIAAENHFNWQHNANPTPDPKSQLEKIREWYQG